jgi:UDP-glucose 4-epimerase
MAVNAVDLTKNRVRDILSHAHFSRYDMNILVTGGAGYIGSHTVKELLKQGYSVTVLDNLSRGHKEAVLSKKFIKADLADKRTLLKIFRKNRFDAVVHFAAFAYVAESMSSPVLYYANNVANTVNLLEVMAASEVKKIVFSSSCSTYGETSSGVPVGESMPQEPINTYAKTKLIDERIIRDVAERSGLRYCILRYFNAAGSDPEGELGEDHDPEPHLIPVLLRAAMESTPVKILGRDYPTLDGTCVRDYTHVSDLARAHVLGLERMNRENGIFNLGTGKGYSILQVIDICEKVTGKPIERQFAPRRPGDPSSLVADASLAQQALGWTPRYPALEDMVSSAWVWMTRHPHGYGRRRG